MANRIFTDKNAGLEGAGRTVLTGFSDMDERSYADCIRKMDLSMDGADLALCVGYFRQN